MKISIEINIGNNKQNSNYIPPTSVVGCPNQSNSMEHDRRIAYLESLRSKEPIPPRIVIRSLA